MDFGDVNKVKGDLDIFFVIIFFRFFMMLLKRLLFVVCEIFMRNVIVF